MAVTTVSTSVNTTAVPIASGLPFSQAGGQTVVITNLGSNAVFIGGQNVTATTGVQIAAGANLTLQSNGTSTIWAIAAAGPNNVVVGVFA